MQRPPSVIIIAGPTAVGKSAAALSLAQHLGGEIISADSMQVYRHMDIGTEKPSPAERKLVKHHLIDILDPHEGYSAGRFRADAAAVIDSLHAQGKVPIIAGGTGLYIRALTRGLFDAPDAQGAFRQEISDAPIDALYARLAALDPDAAAAIMPADRRRIVRALEVCQASGQRITELRRTLTAPLQYNFYKFALTRDRAQLYSRIDARVEQMIARGLLDETRALIALNPSQTPLQAIGYKELISHLQGHSTLEQAVELIKRNTRRYAKRQLTWFRSEPHMHWIDITDMDTQHIQGRMLQHLSEGQ